MLKIKISKTESIKIELMCRKIELTKTDLLEKLLSIISNIGSINQTKFQINLAEESNSENDGEVFSQAEKFIKEKEDINETLIEEANSLQIQINELQNEMRTFLSFIVLSDKKRKDKIFKFVTERVGGNVTPEGFLKMCLSSSVEFPSFSAGDRFFEFKCQALE